MLLGVLLGGLPTFAATSADHQILAGDFNGDGWTDVIYQPLAGAHGSAEFLAYPDGNFGAPAATWPDKSYGTDWNADAHRIVIGDFNGDGRDDLLLQGAAGLASQVYLAAPDGHFTRSNETLPATFGGLDPSQASHRVVTGDFNGDGRTDLLLQANSFVGTNGVVLAGKDGSFGALDASWADGTLGLSWSEDRASLSAGKFKGPGQSELLVREADVADTGATCCRVVAFDKAEHPHAVVQSWNASYLGVDWDPATHRVIVGDFNADGREDLLIQPEAPGGDLYVLLANAQGEFTAIADRWPSERDGVDWSAESYLLVPEKAKDGHGTTLAMIPQQLGLPYRRARFDAAGRLMGATVLAGPDEDALAALGGDGPVPRGRAGADHANAPSAPALAPQKLAPHLPDGDSPGAMAGSAGVANGTATYTIPIMVPPGRAGMAPALSLGYSSSGGDGHEGVGWSLGGLSAIYRCPATVASDGHARGTEFNSGDRFCLDGEKLMLTSGTYGADGSVYHAEVNGFDKVLANGAQGNGPQSFTVTTADGKTLTYGGSADSRLMNGGTPNSVFTWALTKSVDLDGNEVDYHYVNANGEYYPSEIDYTLGGSGATREVSFGWEPRSAEGADIGNIVHYLAGMKLQTTQLLTTITTAVGGTNVRQYTLEYRDSPATHRPLLDAVQACAWSANGDEHCFNPTSFTYQGEHAPQFAPFAATAANGLADPNPYCNFSAAMPTSGFDMDGDGLGDLAYAAPAHFRDALKWWMRYGKPVGFQAPVPMTANLTVGVPIDFNLDGRTDIIKQNYQGGDSPTWNIAIWHTDAGRAWTVTTTNVTWPVGEPRRLGNYNDNGLENALVGDVNGDGKPDIVTYWSSKNPNTDHLKIWLAQGTGDDLSYSASQTVVFTTSQWIYSAQALDYDADGRTDLLVHYRYASDYTLLLSRDDPDGNVEFTEKTTNVPAYSDVTPLVVADVNGDSLPDILEADWNNGAGHWNLFPNTGDPQGQFAPGEDTGIAIATAANYPLDELVRTVREPSGRTDLLVPTARTYLAPETGRCNPNDMDHCGGVPLTAAPCSGKNFRTSQAPNETDGYNWTLYRAVGDAFDLDASSLTLDNLGTGGQVDFNHDGLDDIVGALDVIANGNYTRTVKAYQFTFAGGGGGDDTVPDLLASTDNGFGISDQFTYQPLAQLSDARSGASSSYPEMLFASPMQVVIKQTETSPTGSTNAYDYTYQDARYNVAGRGFLGFATITTTDEARGTKTETDYDQTFPYIGRINRTRTFKTGQATAFAVSTHDWDDIVQGGANSHRYLVLEDASTQVQADPGSTDPPHASLTGNFTLIAQSSSSETVSAGNVDDCGNVAHSTTTTTTQQATETVVTDNTWDGGNVDACAQDTLNQQILTTTVNYTASPTTSDALTTTTNYSYYASDLRVKTKDVSSSHGLNASRHWRYTYDTYGNPASVTQSAAGLDDRITISSYGPDGYFPLSVTNPLGQPVTFTFDGATGNKTRESDPNGIETDYAFDAFGRSAGGRAPGASAVALTYLDPGGDYACPAQAAFVVARSQAGYPDSYTCTDAFGHTLRQATQGFDGSWIYVNTTYTALGQVAGTSAPYFAGATAFVTQDLDYDLLDRPAEIDYPNGRTKTMDYSGLAVTTADSAGGTTHTDTQIYDGLGSGHLIEVDQQRDDGGWIKATYRYDAGGNLTRATDPLGNAIVASYDAFGDKLALTDPDKGAWSYGYDGFGEQTTVTDARGQTITTDYDALGRKSAEHDPADAGGRLSTWTYDTAHNGIGEVASETVQEQANAGGDPPVTVYQRLYGYDTAGRATASEITVDGTTYLEGTSYDDEGRPSLEAYPAMGGGADQAPLALNAEADPPGPVATGATVELNASDSDPDGWGLSYHWQETSGPAATLTDAYQAQAQAMLPVAGHYQFQVTVDDGFHRTSDTVSIEADDLPAGGGQPSATPATSYDGSLDVNWGSITGATSYKLEEDGGPGDPETYSVTSTDKSVTGRAVGTYTFKVQGCNEVGCGRFGAPSTAVSVAAPPPPSKPVVGPSPSHHGSYTVSWGVATGADFYDLDEQHGGSWTEYDNLDSRQWPATQSANGTWNYKVRGCSNETGCGAWSAVGSETVDFIPAIPTGLEPAPPFVDSGNPYTLSWDAMAHATRYDLSGAATQNGITGTSQNETAPVLDPYQSLVLSWQVRACNGSGECSDWSAAVNVHDQGPRNCPPGQICNPQQAPQRRPHNPSPHTLSGGGTDALIVSIGYNAAGYARTLTRTSDGTVYGTIEAMDAWGHATLLSEANGVTVSRAYSPVTGLALSLTATRVEDETVLAQYTYDFDHFGNLAERDDVLAGASETESYDALNRLKKSILTLAGGGGGTTTYAYDDAGDLTLRSDRGSYSYGENGAGPHAVSSISDGSTFAYNANGEMTADNDKTLTWATFGQAIGISQGGSEVELGYDAEDARYQKTVAAASGSETVRYLGAAECIDLNGQTSIRRTLTLADMTIIDTGGPNAGLLFPISDHLGSTIVLGDDDGQSAESMSYGPFGRRMTAGWAGYMSISQALTINQTESDRGYTGQEGLDAVGLWDDNARLYDPALGRFLSVDPLIAHPESTQGINPYSYVENNPLNATDPTGMAAALAGFGSCQTEGCERTIISGGVGFGGIDLNVGVGKGGSLTVSASDGPGNIQKASRMSLVGFFAANSTGKTNLNDSTSLGNQQPASAGGISTYNEEAIDEDFARQKQGIDPVAPLLYLIGGLEAKGIGLTVKLVDVATPAVEEGVAGGLRAAAKLGKLAERAVGDIGKKEKISINGRSRVPDGITRTTLSEVKNVRSQSFTRQLRDYSDYVRGQNELGNPMRFDLYLRPDTKVSGPLQQAIDSGLINRLNIPPW